MAKRLDYSEAGMRYGFTKTGDFVVVDDENRIGSFSYDSSPNATAAKRNPAKVAKRILNENWKECPAHIQEEHYKMSCKELENAINS